MVRMVFGWYWMFRWSLNRTPNFTKSLEKVLMIGLTHPKQLDDDTTLN